MTASRCPFVILSINKLAYFFLNPYKNRFASLLYSWKWKHQSFFFSSTYIICMYKITLYFTVEKSNISLSFRENRRCNMYEQNNSYFTVEGSNISHFLSARQTVYLPKKKPTTPGVPRWSPIQLLARRDRVSLRWSNENRCFPDAVAVVDRGRSANMVLFILF